MTNKTLYVSDLDGTLMRSNEKLSDYTISTVNELVRQGLDFTYATARSIDSAREITQDLKIKLPVITRNGSVLADNITGRSLEITVFREEDIRMIRKLIPELPSHGFVSCYIGDKMIKTYADTEHTEGLAEDAPAMELASSMKNWVMPVFSRNAPKMTKSTMKFRQARIGVPMMPSAV